MNIFRKSFENELHNLREIYRPNLNRWFVIPRRSDPAETRYISIDYSEMLKDRELKNAITISHNINHRENLELQQLQLKVESVIHDIERELERF